MGRYQIGVFLLTIILFACKPSEHKESLPLLVGIWPDNPPLIMQQNREIIGFYIDLANEIAHELKRKAIFIERPASGLTAALHEGKVDMIFSTTSSEVQDAEIVDFSDALWGVNFVLVSHQDHPLSFVGELTGKKLGAIHESMAENYIRKVWEPQGIDFKLFSLTGSAMLFDALTSKKLDAILVEKVQGEYFRKADASLIFSDVGTTDHAYVIGVKKASPLLKEINAVLAEFKKSGRLDKIKAKWMVK